MAAAPDSVKVRVKKLVERGLERYGVGDLEAALSEWEHALTLDPDNRQAAEYSAYVRGNFAGLAAAFSAAQRAAEAAREQGVPLGETPASRRGDDYAEIEMSGGEDIPTPEEILDGWDLAAAPLPPLPPTPAGQGAGAPPEASGTFASAAPPTGSDLEGFALADLRPLSPLLPLPPTQTGKRSALPREEVEPETVSRGFGDSSSAGRTEWNDSPTGESTLYRLRDHDLAIVDSEAPPELPEAPGSPPELPEVPEDKPENTGTGERTNLRRFEGGAPYNGPPAELDMAGDEEPSVEVDPELMPAETTSVRRAAGPAHLGIGVTVDEDGDTGVRPTPVGAGEVRERLHIEGMISVARESFERGDAEAAFDAAEVALRAAGDDERLAEATVGRYRELFSRIYEAFLGPSIQVPSICVPVHQLGATDLDHRAAFLLSRVDGALTIDEILDIAGMPRHDALHILALLVRKRFLEVR